MGLVGGVRPRDSRFFTVAAVSQAKGLNSAATVASTMAAIRMYSRRDVVKILRIGDSRKAFRAGATTLVQILANFSR